MGGSRLRGHGGANRNDRRLPGIPELPAGPAVDLHGINKKIPGEPSCVVVVALDSPGLPEGNREGSNYLRRDERRVCGFTYTVFPDFVRR